MALARNLERLIEYRSKNERSRTMLLAYPTELPTEAWTILLDAVHGNWPDKAKAAQVAWHCSGYFLGKVVGGTGPMFSTKDSADKHLEDFCNAMKSGGMKAGAWDWKKLLDAALKILTILGPILV